MITTIKPNSTKSQDNRNSRGILIAYLTEVSIEPEQFSCEYIIKALDYNGRQQSGFFDKSAVRLFQGSEKNPSLEINIIRLELKDNWAFVKPKGGYFFESDNGIPVFASDLIYEFPED